MTARPLLLLALAAALSAAALPADARSARPDAAPADSALRAKLDPALHRLVLDAETPRAHRGADAGTAVATPLLVECTDADALAAAFPDLSPRRLAPDLLSLTATPADLRRLAADPRVLTLDPVRRFRPLLDRARAQTGVDNVQAGRNLDTPFTGRGVIMAVIDRSFQFRHPAFLTPDGRQSRVIALWDRSGYDSRRSLDRSLPVDTTLIPDATDHEDLGGGGHGTHVANIAAGTDVGNHLRGVAPEASLVLIPSTFENTEVIEDVRFVDSLSRRKGMPWVANMSFGAQIGPHDGTTAYDRAVAAVTRPGGIVVAAMGNEGADFLHAAAELRPGDTRYVRFTRETKGPDADRPTADLDLWSLEADGTTRFSVRLYVVSHGKLNPRNAAFWTEYATVHGNVNRNNRREHRSIHLRMNDIRAALDDPSADVVVAVTLPRSAPAPRTFHLWCERYNGNFARTPLPEHADRQVMPDNEYIVGEGAASIPTAIAVGSFTTRLDYPDAERLTAGGNPTLVKLNYTDRVGLRSYFSSNGPFLNPARPKPTVLGPGSMIRSATNALAPGFDPKGANAFITDIVRRDDRNYYYSAMQGTSMASPFVAGVIALWLQASPTLSPTDVEWIIRESSRRPAAMNGAEWTPEYGYGRIDAFAGLKLALRHAADPTALPRPAAGPAPVTLSLEPSSWRILFHADEPRAEITLTALDGRTLLRRVVERPRAGSTVELTPADLAPAAPALMVLRIATPGAVVTRKVAR